MQTIYKNPCKYGMVMDVGCDFGMTPLTTIIPKQMAALINSTLIRNCFFYLRDFVSDIYAAVGYLGEKLAHSGTDAGVKGTLTSDGHDSAWRIGETLFNRVNESGLISTSDKKIDIDINALQRECLMARNPPRMIVPVGATAVY